MSRSFLDNRYHTWTVSIDIAAVKRVRALIAVDLLTMLEPKALQELASDPVKLVDIVYALCKPQADAAGITDEQFGESMAGDAIEHATVALMDAIVDFHPSSKDRENLRRVIAGLRATTDELRDMAASTIDAQMERARAEALRVFGERCSSSPVLSE